MRRSPMRLGLGAAWVCLGMIVPGGVALAQLNFVACPIVRDTKTVPCFLAEYDGELYFLGVQFPGVQQDIASELHSPQLEPPQLKHEVLVEGRVAEGPRVCGGIPLEPLSISVLKEINLACNTLLPAEPGIEAPPRPNVIPKSPADRANPSLVRMNSRFSMLSTTIILHTPPARWSAKPRRTPARSGLRTLESPDTAGPLSCRTDSVLSRKPAWPKRARKMSPRFCAGWALRELLSSGPMSQRQPTDAPTLPDAAWPSWSPLRRVMKNQVRRPKACSTGL